MKRTFLFLFLLFANLWIYRIFSLNILIGIILVTCSYYLLKRKILLFVLFLIPLIFFQIKTTQKISLTAISNDDRRLIDLRLRAYPRNFLRLGYWLEERKESLFFYRFTTNVFENLDPNLYFFANHPRQRVGITEFEKFPYILFPVFLIGLAALLKKKEVYFWISSFLIPIVFYGLIGNKSSLGPLSLFPFFVTTLSLGLTRIKINWIKIVLFVLVFVQIVCYQAY